MEFVRKKGEPLYLQIQSRLEQMIRSGALKNRRLPPVRAMAAELRVNPNTVQRAYRELSRSGVTAGQAGRGTFLTTTPSGLKLQVRRKTLRKAIGHSLEEALALEFSLTEFEEAVRELVREKLDIIRHVKLAFIECNIEQLSYFTGHLELDPNVRTLPVLLADLRARRNGALAGVREADIIVTSFYHLDEVNEHPAAARKPVMGVNLEPETSTLIEIARIPFEKSVGIVTGSEQCRREIRNALRDAGIQFKRLSAARSTKPREIRRVVSRCDAVLVSPHQKETVAGLAGPWVKIIEFVFKPDKTSIHNLKVALLEVKKNLMG